jgi:hypothetical protein
MLKFAFKDVSTKNSEHRHISVSSFVYKYDQWPHDSYMTGRASVSEADDIVQFYIALLDFFPAKHNFESGHFQTFCYLI